MPWTNVGELLEALGRRPGRVPTIGPDATLADAPPLPRRRLLALARRHSANRLRK